MAPKVADKRSKWFIPFRYKLTLLINTIVLVLLSGTFLILQHQIENNAVTNIKNNLKSTKAMISRLLEDRQTRLQEIARGIGGAELIRIILTDPTLDQITRDNIVEEEILPDYPQLNLLGVADIDGMILALNQVRQSLSRVLSSQDFFQAGLEGEIGSGFLIDEDNLMQIMALPITIGDIDVEEILGILVVGIILSQEDLERIKALSEADLMFLREDSIFLSTEVQLINGQPLSTEALSVFCDTSEVSDGEPEVVSIKNERFLYSKVSDQREEAPPYIVAKSLDQQLTFVRKIRQFMIQFGIAGLVAGVLVGYLFALEISHPIKSLRTAAEEVDRGNFHYQVNIQSRDEFSQLGNSFNQMIQGLNEKERIRGVMNKVVSKEIADEILKSDLQLGGEEKTATILFSDIRGFTTFSEALKPGELLELLNKYFTRINAVIDVHRGNIDKYIGDAVMALFGAPLAHEDDPKNAVLAAIDMIDALKEFNYTLEQELGKTIDIGIGINTGLLIAGLMGASTRMEYTVMGDVVNLASRLEGLTKKYDVQIVISESTYLAVQKSLSSDDSNRIKFRELDTVQVKGKTRGVKIYQVFSRDEIIDGLDERISRFQHARQLLETGQFEKSLNELTALEADWQADPVTKVFLDRVNAYVQNPDLYEQNYRNGVYIFTEK